MKKIRLRLISIIVSVLILCSCFSGMIVFAETKTSGDYDYRILADGTAEITNYGGSDSVIDLPSEIDGYKVTGLGDRAFYYSFYGGSKTVTDVTIPNGITSIGADAFKECTKLKM